MPIHVEHPHLLPLLVVAVLPLVLHILDRRRARKVIWPAARFLVVGAREKLRRLRWLEAVLIAVRTLAVLAIAAAAAKPFLVETSLRPTSAGGPSNLVLVVDTSFSTAYRDDGESASCLRRAQDAALRAVARAGPRARTEVLAGPGRKEGTEAARLQIRALEPGPGAFVLADALSAAADVALALPPAPTEIVVFTDLAASILEDDGPDVWERLRSRVEALPTRPAIRLVDCGSPTAHNNTVQVVRTGGRARGADRELEIECEVASFSARAPTALTGESITLRLESGVREIAVETLAAGRRPATIRVVHRFRRGGEQVLSARIPADGLREDDVRHRVLDVLETVRVLVVGDTDASGHRATEFVRLALAPDETATSVFRPEESASLTSEDLTPYRLAVLCDVSDLVAEDANRIESFVRAGGGLLVLLGGEIRQESWNRLLYRRSGGVLPARLGARASAGPASAAHPSSLRTTHPVLALFAAPEEGDLTRIDVARWIRLEDLAPDAIVLASLESAGETTPWIVAREHGEGKVVVVSTSATAEGSSLPRSTLFLPLIQELARWLAVPSTAARELIVGEPIELVFPDAAAVARAVVVDPAGDRHAVELAVRSGRPLGVFRDTRRPGVYSVHPDEPGPDSRPRLFAAHVPPEESDVRRIDAAELEELTRALGIEVFRHDAAPRRELVETRSKRALWPLLAAVAACLLLLELALARRLGRPAPRP